MPNFTFNLRTLRETLRTAGDYDPEKRLPNPRRDWMLLLALSAAGIAAAAGMGMYEFQLVNTAPILLPLKPSERTISIDEATVNGILSSYAERQQAFDALLAERPVSPPDPSL